MIEDTLTKIEARLRKGRMLAEDQRTELLALLSTLKTEIGELSKTHSERAQASQHSPKCPRMKPRARSVTLSFCDSLWRGCRLRFKGSRRLTPNL